MAAGVTFRFARPEGFGNPFGGQDCANRDTGRERDEVAMLAPTSPDDCV